MTTGTRKPGEFCWINMLTPQPVEARMGVLQSHWRTYFTVQDVDEAARKAVERSAAICMTIKEVPGRRFCGITSPQGVTFCVVEYTH